MIINTNGYVLHKKDYGDFDEIITIVNDYGNKFVCLCLGTKKITSKNARHLNYGDYIEFEFFFSPSKLSKLKSAKTITFLPEKLKANYTLPIMNELYTQLELGHVKWFHIYQTMILNIIAEVNDYVNLLNCLVMTYKASGLAINFDACVLCNTTYHLEALAFKNYGVVCKSCYSRMEHLKLDPPLYEAFKKMQTDAQNPLKNLVFDHHQILRLIRNTMDFMHQNLGVYFSDFKALE